MNSHKFLILTSCCSANHQAAPQAYKSKTAKTLRMLPFHAAKVVKQASQAAAVVLGHSCVAKKYLAPCGVTHVTRLTWVPLHRCEDVATCSVVRTLLGAIETVATLWDFFRRSKVHPKRLVNPSILSRYVGPLMSLANMARLAARS